MSRAYKNRRKAIRDLKKELGYPKHMHLPPEDMERLTNEESSDNDAVLSGSGDHSVDGDVLAAGDGA